MRTMRKWGGWTWAAVLGVAMCFWSDAAKLTAEEIPAGNWLLEIDCPGGAIRCGLELSRSGDQWSASLVNGEEKIQIPKVEQNGTQLLLSIDHYDSRLTFETRPTVEGASLWKGTWKKRRGVNDWVRMKTRLLPQPPTVASAPAEFAGRWKVDFASSDDPAVGQFELLPNGEYRGTFLTTTGDYRFLQGSASDQQLKLSCFDGAHAFLFHAKLTTPDQLEGEFWSSDRWHENWTAVRDADASLPDSFRQTLVNQKVKLADFEFPDLDGNPVNLDSERFRGKPRLIYVFGSWCPNCHDAAAYFSELEKEYASRGLSILGLAFEVTGNFERDSEQVRKYLKRHDCQYPVLIAGVSDKQQASRSFPLLDRIRSYPTTLFIDRDGTVRAVHTGFTGPATGKDYEQLKRQFTEHIEAMLSDTEQDNR